jgi:hypothetical protein
MKDLPDILREYRVKIVPADVADLVSSSELGMRTKFGGAPDLIQREDERVTCPRCFRPMHFVAQIDSFEFNGKDNSNRQPYGEEQFMFGDVGMIYVRFCFNCLTPHATTECY